MHLIEGPKIFVEELLAQYRVTVDFQEKDSLLSYFAEKAGIPPNCAPFLTFFYCTQGDPQAEIPKF